MKRGCLLSFSLSFLLMKRGCLLSFEAWVSSFSFFSFFPVVPSHGTTKYEFSVELWFRLVQMVMFFS